MNDKFSEVAEKAAVIVFLTIGIAFAALIFAAAARIAGMVW